MRYHQLVELIAHVKPATIYSNGNASVNEMFLTEALKHRSEAILVSEGHANPDLVFVNSLDDYERHKHAKCVIIDGYKKPEHEKFKAIGDMVLLPGKDPDGKGGKTQLVVTPASTWPGKYTVDVKTRNCVPDENIQANIRYSRTLVKKWIVECASNDETILMVSGGPSLLKALPEIKQRKEKIVCVKHSHDILLKAGIKPWACMLLDPRPHVKDFVDNPQDGVIYFCASMVHPSTTDALLNGNANIWGYNAYVGAGEDRVLKEFGGDIMIGGGSTSSIRGVSMLYSIGFRKFHLFGYDLCYPGGKPKKGRKTNAKIMKVEVLGRQFWSDAEFIAESKDFETLLKLGKDMEITVHGDGMIPHIWNATRKILPSYKDVIGG